MIQDWRTRLLKLLEDKDKSMREASLNAGVSAGYLHGVLKDGKDPGVEQLAKVCDSLGISLSWLLYGFDISQNDEFLLQQIHEAEPQDKEALLQLLKKRRGTA